MERTISEHIEITSGVCGGKPRIAGNRIRVQDIVVWHEMQGQTPEEIVANFPQITLADVHAALAYYHDHREEIREDMRKAEEIVGAAKVRHPSKLAQKLVGREANGGSVSSG